MYKEEIATIAGRRADGAMPGEQTYLPAFQGAVTEFMEGLDDEQISELESKRAEWINTGHPIEVQRKMADAMGRGFLQSSAETQYKEMGMRSVVWEFHENKSGTKLFQLLSRPKLFGKYLSDILSHDFNENVGKVKVLPFIEKFPDAVANFRKAWVEYMLYCYKVESGSSEVESVAAQNRQSTSLIILDRDPKGYPLVPQENGNLTNMKHIVRSFITAHYRRFICSFC